MKFNFPRRPAEFGGFNNRSENHGEQKVKAIDLPFRIQVRIAKELDMLAPVGTPDGVKFSNFLYGPNLRKPQLSCMVLSPMKLHRRPEHIKVVIYDQELRKNMRITFDEVTVKDPTLEYEEDAVYLSGKLQIHPTTEQLARIVDNVENKTREFECVATAPELFDNDEGEEGDDGQVDMVGKDAEKEQDGESDEDDDDDEEDEDD